MQCLPMDRDVLGKTHYMKLYLDIHGLSGSHYRL